MLILNIFQEVSNSKFVSSKNICVIFGVFRRMSVVQRTSTRRQALTVYRIHPVTVYKRAC